MKVKIGNEVHDANDKPILLILDDSDKKNILNMTEESNVYCAYPDGVSNEAIDKWMSEV